MRYNFPIVYGPKTVFYDPPNGTDRKLVVSNRISLCTLDMTDYFFNLEKRNFEKKVVAQLKLENGEIISDMKQINLEIESFYSNY